MYEVSTIGPRKLKLSSGNENVTNRSIYSNSDLDLGPIEPKSNFKHPPSIINLCMKFEYRSSKETKVIVRKRKRNGRPHAQTTYNHIQVIQKHRKTLYFRYENL
jgi:hypothetical protein